jgi:hypothetical protein
MPRPKILITSSEEFLLKIKAQEWVKHIDPGLDFFQGNSRADVPLPSHSEKHLPTTRPLAVTRTQIIRVNEAGNRR